MARPTYDHRQIAWLLPAIGVLVVPLVFIAPATGEGGYGAAAAMTLLLIAVYASFSSLRTTIADDELHVRFTFGWPRRRIPIDAIREHRQVRNKWYYGLGIRKVPGGWLYAVWGLDAVELTYDSAKGEKMFRIGTNDVTKLDRKISDARTSAR